MSSNILSAKEIVLNDVFGSLWTQQDGARVAQTVMFVQVSFPARCIVKMGPLLKLYANRGRILSGKFIIL